MKQRKSIAGLATVAAALSIGAWPAAAAPPISSPIVENAISAMSDGAGTTQVAMRAFHRRHVVIVRHFNRFHRRPFVLNRIVVRPYAPYCGWPYYYCGYPYAYGYGFPNVAFSFNFRNHHRW
jgi:hypothetical protein